MLPKPGRPLPRREAVSFSGSSRRRSAVALSSLALTTVALMATSKPGGSDGPRYTFAHSASGSPVTLDASSPAAAFAVRVRLVERTPDGRPFGAPSLRVSGNIEQAEDNDVGPPGTPRWVSVRLTPVEEQNVGDAGSPALVPHPDGEPKLLSGFDVTSYLPLFGDCAADAPSGPCEGLALLSFESGGGPGAVHVTWGLEVSGEAPSTEGDVTVPSPVELVVTKL